MIRASFFFVFLLAFTAIHAQNTDVVVDLKVQGLKRTRVSEIKKLTKLKAGMSLDSVLIKKDIERLKRLPSISHAYFQVFPAVEPNRYNVFYNIEENFTLIPFANLFSSSNDDFAFRIGLEEFNFLGRNIQLGGFYQYDIFNSYGVTLKAPYLFTDKLGLGVSYNNLTTQEPVFFENDDAKYKYNNAGIEFSGLYQFNFSNKIELGVNFFVEDYEYISGATSPEVPLALRVRKHLIKFIYDYNNVNYEYQYLEGFKSYLNFQYVGSSDATLPEFLIGFNDFAYYHRIGKRGNLANRLRLGLASNLDTPFAPFSVDNNLNVRGVGNTIDRGTGVVILNSEYRHTLIDKDWFILQSNVFVDAGSWRNPGGDFSDFGQDQNIRVFPGVGLRFIHKKIFNAIFRIDYGVGVTEKANGIVFGIGQYF